MTFSDFETLMGATLIRDSSTVLAEGTALTTAINNAKRSAQLLHDFEYCRTTATFSVDSTNGALYTAATDTVGGGTISVKRIEAAALSDGQPLRVIDQVGYRRMLARGAGRTVDETDPPPTAPYTAYVVTQNGRLYIKGNNITSANSPYTITAEVVYFLPDFSGASDTDFFLDQGLDWMILAVGQRMNHFLKDDERIPIDLRLLELRWQELMTWDGALRMPADEYNLD